MKRRGRRVKERKRESEEEEEEGKKIKGRKVWESEEKEVLVGRRAGDRKEVGPQLLSATSQQIMLLSATSQQIMLYSRT